MAGVTIPARGRTRMQTVIRIAAGVAIVLATALVVGGEPFLRGVASISPHASGTPKAAATEAGGMSAAVRINALDEGGRADLEVLATVVAQNASRLSAVMLPKAEDPSDVAAVADALGGTPVVALGETARGLAAAEALARTPNVVRLGFGALDFGVDVDATSPILLDHARCELVLASRRAEVAAPLDSPNPEFRDLHVIGERAAASRALGFGGQLCIHPAQVPIVAAAFRPSDEEIAWAERIVAVGAGSASQVDGSMVDRPVYLRAQSILEHAGRPTA